MIQHLFRHLTPSSCSTDSQVFLLSVVPSMNLVILLLSPYIPWNNALCSKGDVIRWAVAALAVPYTKEVGWDAVRSLLRSVCHSSLRPHIPIEILAWLKKHSTLPPPYQGLGIEITSETVRCARTRGCRNSQVIFSSRLVRMH